MKGNWGMKESMHLLDLSLKPFTMKWAAWARSGHIVEQLNFDCKNHFWSRVEFFLHYYHQEIKEKIDQ